MISQFFKHIPRSTRTLNDDDSTIDQPQTIVSFVFIYYSVI